MLCSLGLPAAGDLPATVHATHSLASGLDAVRHTPCASLCLMMQELNMGSTAMPPAADGVQDAGAPCAEACAGSSATPAQTHGSGLGCPEHNNAEQHYIAEQHQQHQQQPASAACGPSTGGSRVPLGRICCCVISTKGTCSTRTQQRSERGSCSCSRPGCW